MKLKEIKGVFKSPKKKYYFGPLVYGTPYFWPIGFNSTILSVRKLIENSEERIEEISKDRPWLKKESKFRNIPIVRRCNNWIIKFFNSFYYIEIGSPIKIKWNDLGWKDKYDSPRFEWPPAFYIFFFKWQFVIHWNAPDNNNDKYYEMILWWAKYSDKNIRKAKKTWPWINMENKKSTWDNSYIIKHKLL